MSKIIYVFSSGFFCTVTGGVIGTGISLKIAQSHINQYAKGVEEGKYLLIVSGKADAIRRAKQLMQENSLQKR